MELHKDLTDRTLLTIDFEDFGSNIEEQTVCLANQWSVVFIQ